MLEQCSCPFCDGSGKITICPICENSGIVKGSLKMIGYTGIDMRPNYMGTLCSNLDCITKKKIQGFGVLPISL